MTPQQLAADLGSLETWDGTDVYVLRNDHGHFVTWAKATAATPTQTAVADGGEPMIEWTDGGKDVTVTADRGTLYVSLEGPDVSFTDVRADLTTVKGREVLDAGHQRTDDGEKIRALVTIGDRREDIEQLREGSEPEQTDTPLAYEVREWTTTGSWDQEITHQKLVATKDRAEMTERQRELHRKVDADNDVPEDAIAGDVYTAEDLLDDPRTGEEREQDAIEEAAETGESVVINKSTTSCNDPSKECSLDKVTRIATPEGEIKTERTHTY